MITLRTATMDDADDLFAWRNDPVTLASFRSTSPVSREDHDLWMKYRVMQGYPEHLVLIAESEYGSVGVVRFDGLKNDSLAYEASITIAPEFRKLGFAREVLAQGCFALKDYAINAEIRKENIASRKIFERCGFKRVGKRDGFVNYRREPLS